MLLFIREIQRKGVGRALFQKFYQCALNQGYAFIRLEVLIKIQVASSMKKWEPN